MSLTVGPFAEIRRHRGRPVVFVVGQPDPPMAWRGNLARFHYIGECDRMGITWTSCVE